MLDLSNVTTSEGAVAIFQDWADKIEKNPQLWKGGWNLNSLCAYSSGFGQTDGGLAY